MAKKIALMSGKGGVGKSSAAAMVGKILSEKHRTIILDFDICGPSITTTFGTTDTIRKTECGFEPVAINEMLSFLSFGSILKPNDAVIWRGAKKTMFLEMFLGSTDKYDYVVIDTPPGISEEHEFLIEKDVEVILMTTPQNMSLNDAQKCIEFCLENNIKILGVVENMSWLRCECCEHEDNPFGSGGGKLLAEEYGLKMLGQLGIEPNWGKSLDRGEFNSEYKQYLSYKVFKDILVNLEIV